MATDEKTERLLNLLITLLVSRTFVTKERLRAAMEAYRDLDDAAFEKKFERDKEDLRALGVPIEVGSHEAYFDDAVGYRVRPDAFALPEIEVTADEAAVLGLAARVWQHAGLASRTEDALVKLRAGGVTVAPEALEIAQPRLDADEPAFPALWDATVHRTAVTFDYRRAGSLTATPRRLHPWGLVSLRGRWYVVGHDLDREDTRVFRLSRVQGEVRTQGRSGAYDVPTDLDLREVAKRLLPPEPTARATLRVRAGAGLGLRARAEQVEALPSGDRLTVPYALEHELADEVLSYGADVVVEGPGTLRDLVVARLRAAAGVPA